MRINALTFLDLDFDNLPFDEVKARLAKVSAETPYSYVVTPNVDHLVRLEDQPHLRSIYEDAGLCVCDSRILAILARLQGDRLEVVPGSDLTETLFREVIQPGDRIAIVGGDRQLITQLRAKYESVEFAHHVPPMGLSHDTVARQAASAFVASANARFTLLAVGSPQQEIIARDALSMAPSGGVALCIGASLDFLTGRQKRAPRVLRRLGLEWAHRLMTNPRRLWRRYLVDGLKIFPIYAGQRRLLVGGCALGALAAVGLAAAAFYSVLASELAPSTSGTNDELDLNDAQGLRLPAPDLLRPLSPEEATAANAERPFVRRPDQGAAGFHLRAAPEDKMRAETCLAQAIHYEAGGEGLEGARAVAQVVLNRVRHPAYPASVCGVVYQGAERLTGCQFSFTCDGSLRRAPAPSAWANAKQIAEQALSGRVFAPVGHATHFHANYVLPYWADSLDKSLQVGRHIFYRLRGSLGASKTFAQRYAGSEPEVNSNTALVIASQDVDQLVDGLIADDVNSDLLGALAPHKPSLIPNSPLEVDKVESTLIVDINREVRPNTQQKVSKKCPEAGNDKQLRPMKADSLAAGLNSNC